MKETAAPVGTRASLEMSVVVTRADGTVEDHGTVAYWHRNPLIRWWKNWRMR